MKTKQISEPILNVLARCTITGNVLRLPEQLDRKVYVEVNEVLDAIGGAWDRKQKGHVFQSDPTADLDMAISTRSVVNHKQLFQQFYTPLPLAARMVAWAGVVPGSLVLEPSAGSGNLVRMIWNAFSGADSGRIVALDIEPKRITDLEAVRSNLNADSTRIGILQCDFLACNDGFGSFSHVVMNPPFAGGQDIQHVYHSYKYLRPGGVLVSIVCEGPFFRQDKRAKAFQDWLGLADADVETLPENSFAESGTSVRARMIKVVAR